MASLTSEKETEHLILLVGGNPLPNAVAGKLLAGHEGTITLVHSRGTANIAQRLKNWFDNKSQANEKEMKLKAVELKEVDESSSNSILQGVQERLNAVNVQSIGLNYTGGTKAMSVHAYRAVEQWANGQRNQGKRLRTVFSYLDARTLEMVFESHGVSSGEQREYVGLALELSLADLLELHGWTLRHDPTRTAILPDTACALADECSNNNGFEDWKQWISNEFRFQCRRQNRDDWKSNSELKKCSLAFPTSSHLSKVVESLKEELALGPHESKLGLEHSHFNNEPKKFCEWLDGKWLEHYVLDVLNNLAGSLCLHDCAQNVETKEVQFDVDVIAIRGYQLFAFSCSTDTRKGLLKLKLFEAYVRARQLGGDEARVALICCSNDPEGLENEMRRDVDPEGRIRVFGRKHLANLKQELEQWIKSQSGER